jgi:DNA-binding NtrC family response regulator
MSPCRCARRWRRWRSTSSTRALEKAGGNRAEAARILGIARPQLYVKLEEHGLRERE